MSGQTPTPETISCDEARARLGMGRAAFKQAVREGWVVGFHYSGSHYFGIRARFDAFMAARDLQPPSVEEPTVPLPTPIPFVSKRGERTG